MQNIKKVAYAICFGIFISGLTILLSYKTKLIGLILVTFSLALGYFLYRRNRIYIPDGIVNLRNAALGAILIIMDISYNVITGGAFASFDYGMLLSGLFIVLLNLNFLKFLKLDRQFADFTTLFLFFIMLFYGTLFTGLPFLLGAEENPLFIPVTKLAVTSSGSILNLIKPTATIGGTDINFDGFTIGVWIPCSGVESITVFISAIAAFLISTREKNILKMIKLSVIGIVALFSMNILRITILVLVGRYYGVDALMFTHYNLGWIMFVIGMGIFWYLVFDTRETGKEIC